MNHFLTIALYITDNNEVCPDELVAAHAPNGELPEIQRSVTDEPVPEACPNDIQRHVITYHRWCFMYCDQKLPSETTVYAAARALIITDPNTWREQAFQTQILTRSLPYRSQWKDPLAKN